MRWRAGGITRRIAALSWLVTLATLSIFILAVVPEQRRTFRESLRSKAYGIAETLPPTALVNGDYSTVAEQCLQMLAGDRSIDFLMISKHDGFGLYFYDRGKFRQVQSGAEWRPAGRQPIDELGWVPAVQRRVYHFAKPFAHSGIDWGWIHVGLKLDLYDQSVARVYRRTAGLAVLCLGLGLAASAVSARQLVRPLHSLRSAVRRVAQGDLTVRAAIRTGDEVESLAESFNSMAEALGRRDRILESVRYAAQEFLTTADWAGVAPTVLAKIGLAADASLLRMIELRSAPGGGLRAELRGQWVASGAEAATAAAGWCGGDLAELGLGAWLERLARQETVAIRARDLPAGARVWVAGAESASFLVSPIQVDGRWWGVLSLAECRRERDWTEAERDSLRVAAGLLGTAIARKRTEDALLEAKATLEERVEERTRELRELVAAKDKAHAALAEAQRRLVEASRLAGMSEVATGVLHSVGNVLNSVNVSTGVVYERLQQSRVSTLSKTAALLREHKTDLPEYLTQDPQGQRVPVLLEHLAAYLENERAELLREVTWLGKNVQHIKEIVAMQQGYAKQGGVFEALPVVQLVEDALLMNEEALRRGGVEVVRDYRETPTLLLDKHRVMQILLNLIRNAAQAMNEKAGPYAKRLRIELGREGTDRFVVTVEDNGVGISQENLTRIFAHGFTTRKQGHGFGLHMGALAARELGGALRVASDGPERGATFRLELPVRQAES